MPSQTHLIQLFVDLGMVAASGLQAVCSAAASLAAAQLSDFLGGECVLRCWKIGRVEHGPTLRVPNTQSHTLPSEQNVKLQDLYQPREIQR